jgi:hypothetical protein
MAPGERIQKTTKQSPEESKSQIEVPMFTLLTFTNVDV